MLSDEGLPLVEVPQSVERMTSVLGALLELIKRGDLRHDGDDGLRTHVLNAVRGSTSGGSPPEIEVPRADRRRDRPLPRRRPGAARGAAQEVLIAWA